MELSWKRVLKTVSLIVLASAAAGGVYFIVTFRPVKIAWASLVLDNREHFFTCEQLPFYPQVQKALSVHADVVANLKGAGAFEVKPNLIKCKNFEGGIEFMKGDIEIDYSTHQQRQAVEKLIGDNFFGIPYRGYNR